MSSHAEYPEAPGPAVVHGPREQGSLSENPIVRAFAQLRADGRRGIMPFVCAGHPTPAALPDLLLACSQAGALAVEIGFPFSDPIADGPVIASAMHEALSAGHTSEHVFEQVAQATDSLKLTADATSPAMGLVAMVSMSIIHRLGGPGGFCDRAAASGFHGLIVPDVPLDESEDIIAAASEHGLTCSMLVSPTTSVERAQEIARRSTGFVYMVARTGITGVSADLPDIGERVEQIRSATDTPIACGFGISTPDHVRHVVQHADAAIVGSALVRHLTSVSAAGEHVNEACRAFVADLATGLVHS